VQHRPLHLDDAGQIHAWLEGHRETARGQELDLQTQVRVGGQIVWSETSTFLARRQGRSRVAARAAALPNLEVPPRQDVTTSSFIVGPDVGRQYARVSGDFNPIHIADVAARFFGFKRAIAHGMWSLARCAAENRGDRLFQPLHAGCGVQATYCILRPHRARELDGGSAHGFQFARFAGGARPPAGERGPLGLILRAVCKPFRELFARSSQADWLSVFFHTVRSAVRGMGLADTGPARNKLTRARCSYCGGE